MKKWIEVADECFGPDKKGRGWQMFLVIKRCCSYIAKKKSGLTKIVQRKDDCILLSGKRKKDVLQQLQNFIGRKDVMLLEKEN